MATSKLKRDSGRCALKLPPTVWDAPDASRQSISTPAVSSAVSSAAGSFAPSVRARSVVATALTIDGDAPAAAAISIAVPGARAALVVRPRLVALHPPVTSRTFAPRVMTSAAHVATARPGPAFDENSGAAAIVRRQRRRPARIATDGNRVVNAYDETCVAGIRFLRSPLFRHVGGVRSRFRQTAARSRGVWRGRLPKPRRRGDVGAALTCDVFDDAAGDPFAAKLDQILGRDVGLEPRAPNA